MSYRIEKDDCRDKGSITLEASFLMTLITGLVLFFISVMQIAAAQNVLEMSVIRTGDSMCKWAPIYKYMIADNIDGVVSEKLVEKLSGKLTDEIEEIIVNIVNLSEIKQNSMDYAYGYVAQTMTQKYIDESPLVDCDFIEMNNLNLYRSIFFENDSNVIQLKAISEVETFLPFTAKVGCEINCGAWGKGMMPHMGVMEEKDETDSIWKRDNYSRGKVIREIYGANLPENFPVISCYENGMVTMIKSLNHKTASYSDGKTFKNTIKQMIDSLASFNEASWGEINIKKKDIKFKRLILVMPEDNLSSIQELALQEVRSYSTTKGILFDLQRYQKV